MEDKLVTLAIHTFEKAQILKTILETEGIEVYIHNVNQIQPVVSAGVRVRIKESDLPHALRIIEDNKWFEEPKEEEAKVNAVKKVLIPIDFSDYSAKACELGINYAHAVGAEVVIMHAYFSPYFPSAIPMGDTLAYQVNEEESVQHILQRVRIDMENICTHINRKMSSGELPKVKYDYVLREGLPEEEIIAYSKEYHPTFNELRRIKDSLPDGSTQRIADELGLKVETVRNYFGGHNFQDGRSCGFHIEPGPDGGLVVLDDTTIFERALQILAESQDAEAQKA